MSFSCQIRVPMQRGFLVRQSVTAVLIARPCCTWLSQTKFSNLSGQRKYRNIVSAIRALPPAFFW